MWKIIFILVFTYGLTGILSQKDETNLMFTLESSGIDDESFLVKSDWREDEKYLLNILSSQIPDCLDVEKITSTDFSSGYMDIVVSPILIPILFTFQQYVRIIFEVPHQHGDLIKLFNSTEASGKPIYEIYVKSAGLNHIDTRVFYKVGQDYTAEYVRRNGEKVITSRYNNVKPSWMWCIKDVIGTRVIGKLFIPGTHDSGSYIKLPSWWKYRVFELYYQYVFTQGESILSQLMQGARSFDLRVAKYDTKDIFYLNHDCFKIRPFKHALDQIKEFLKSYPNEIVLLDFHRFPVGFNSPSDHDQLVSFIKSELGDLIYWRAKSATWGVTLNDIWKTRGRIIIAYNDDSVPKKYNLFPGVEQIWGNVDDPSAFVDYMNTNLPKNCSEAHVKMTSAMAELTPTVWGAVFKYPGLRYLASIINSQVTKDYLLGPWGDAAQSVAVDFLSSTDIVTAAVRQNLLRAHTEHICH